MGQQSIVSCSETQFLTNDIGYLSELPRIAQLVSDSTRERLSRKLTKHELASEFQSRFHLRSPNKKLSPRY